MPEGTADQLKFLRRLRAVREYTPEPIAEDMINDILEVGRWSASGSNRQPCDVIVVRDAATKEKLRDWGANPAGTAAVVFLIVNSNPNATFDEGRMAERLALASWAHGLGSNIATLKGEGQAQVQALLGIPAERRAVTTVCVGHIDAAARAARTPSATPGRKPMSDYAHWDRF